MSFLGIYPSINNDSCTERHHLHVSHIFPGCGRLLTKRYTVNVILHFYRNIKYFAALRIVSVEFHDHLKNTLYTHFYIRTCYLALSKSLFYLLMKSKRHFNIISG